MANKDMDQWGPYLDEIMALWDEYNLGPDFIVNGMDRAAVVEMTTKWDALAPELAAAQAALDRIIDKRQAQIPQLNTFGKSFLAAMEARFGPDSPEAKRAPRVSSRRAPDKKTPVPPVV